MNLQINWTKVRIMNEWLPSAIICRRRAELKGSWANNGGIPHIVIVIFGVFVTEDRAEMDKASFNLDVCDVCWEWTSVKTKSTSKAILPLIKARLNKCVSQKVRNWRWLIGWYLSGFIRTVFAKQSWPAYLFWSEQQSSTFCRSLGITLSKIF